jgi:phosphohistidine swiveling domain-containing protein
MFVIDALYTSILREIQPIDPEHAERELFELATSEIASLVDLLNQELRSLKQQSYEVSLPKLQKLAARFGFLKCRQPFETPYTPQDLFEMIANVPPPISSRDNEAKKKKYFQQEYLRCRLERLREWMRIRNQEMEHLLFAFLAARPLIDRVCHHLSIDAEAFWRSSKESLLTSRSCLAPVHNLTLLQIEGRTQLTDQVEVRFPEPENLTDLRGRTVYGKGTLEATVRIAFSPEELTAPPKRPCVLVTGMTTPDFVPYIRKHFDALITDEGGILCHAAIVAREIPIACIVGTGMSTTVLKDGMRIFIDFDRGEIEKL